MINDKIKKLIKDKFKVEIQYSQQCEALAMAIQEETGQTLSTTTLKRMLGFVNGPAQSRPSSLDILAQYLGYPDYKLLAQDLGENTEISEFRLVENITSDDLMEGEQIQVTYHPNRVLVLSYIGQNLYLVNESRGSKLQKGDKLLISGFYVGFELLISDVERGKQHLGSYVAAKQGGLTSIEILG
ncbi:MAG: hypothetical protein NC111_04825 [Bacteroides sp.]|nr:hypothetical protein [Bacteroides sp.]MCM1413953.1 hypothetical protein [Bacteroides sp.]MCM1471830.1 hypothetical protein [Bacteroides sp.]